MNEENTKEYSDGLDIEDVGLDIGKNNLVQSCPEKAEDLSISEISETASEIIQQEESILDSSDLNSSDRDISNLNDEFIEQVGLSIDGEVIEESIQTIRSTKDDKTFNKLEGIEQKLDSLAQEFQSKLRHDTHKEKIIDNLHEELQSYKSGIIKKYLLSTLMDLIKMIDDIKKWVKHYNDLESSVKDPAKAVELLETIPSDLEDILFLQGVRPYICGESIFNPARQRVIRKIETMESFKDKLVAESLRSGYEWEGRIIRPEMVSVYIYKKAASEE